MEESIRTFCKSLGSFCNHLDSNCDALKQSLERRPIPLDSASSTFIQCLNRRVSSASGDLNLLESMSFGTVSFEELLGHCNEVYKKNQTDLAHLQDRLKSFGYVPEVEIDYKDEVSNLSTSFGTEMEAANSRDGMDVSSCYSGLVSNMGSIMKSLEEDVLLDDSLSLKKLGLSDVCLATLASEANGQTDDSNISLQEPMKFYGDKLHDMKGSNDVGEVEEDLKSVEAAKTLIKVSNDDYESLPSYMKGLAPWEDLLEAVEKINSSLSKKEKTKGSNYFHQDEISSLGLGSESDSSLHQLSCKTLFNEEEWCPATSPSIVSAFFFDLHDINTGETWGGHKARSYLLLLVRMNRLVVETIDGLISYRVL